MLFLGISLLVSSVLLAVQICRRRRRLKPGVLWGLFMFGVLLSVPFVTVEYVGAHMKYYFMILSFIAIEGTVLALENKWRYLHNLVHHNVKSLRMVSYFLIGLGFTYSELIFYVLNSHESLGVIVVSLPFKAVFALFVHTVLTSSTSLITATEFAFEHVLLFLINYLRLVFISVSHYLYVFLVEHKAAYLLIPFLVLNLVAFFRHKSYLEGKMRINA